VEALTNVGVRREIGGIENRENSLDDGHVNGRREKQQRKTEDRREARVEFETEIESVREIVRRDRVRAEDDEEPDSKQRQRDDVRQKQRKRLADRRRLLADDAPRPTANGRRRTGYDPPHVRRLRGAVVP